MRKSRTGPGELTLEQIWLTIQLAVSSQITAYRPFKRFMMSFRHEVLTHFMSWHRQCCFKHLNRHCLAHSHTLHTYKGRRHGFQVQLDLVTNGKCIKVSQRHGLIKDTPWHCPLDTCQMPLLAFYYKNKIQEYNTA